MERNFCLLILFSCNIFAGENFWFSYRVVTENKIVIHEERRISPHMTPLADNLQTIICQTKIHKNPQKSTYNLLNENFEQLLPCFYPMNSKVVNRTLIENRGILEVIDLNIVPIEFTVDFKDQFANISILVPPSD